MHDVIISKLNSTYIHVACDNEYIEREIYDKFSFQSPNAKFDQRVKRGYWDGYIRLFDRKQKKIFAGLLFSLVKFLKESNYKIRVDPQLIPQSSLDLETIKSIVEDIIQPHDNGEPVVPYDYQYKMLEWQLNSGRSISLAATSAGKSLCIYLALRLYQMTDDMDGKHLFVIVPSTMLVEQLYADFENYSSEDKYWSAFSNCQKISGKYAKSIDKQIVITTWQSLKNMDRGYLERAGAIFVDEAHTVKGPVLAELMQAATECSIRHGLTGTLDDWEANILSAEGLIGPKKVIVTAKEIIDAGRATPIKINVVVVDYDDETKESYNRQVTLGEFLPAQRYNEEVKFINSLNGRFKFIQNLISNLKGNTIVLFDRVEDLGVPLYEDMKSRHSNTFLIVGDVKIDEREKIRNLLDGIDDGVVYATSTIMSTGVSIKNLHHMVYVSSSKAKIRLLQSIGRLMRLHSSKKEANLWDIVDKLDYMGQPNYVLQHVEERIKHYSKEKHKVRFHKVKIDENSESRGVL